MNVTKSSTNKDKFLEDCIINDDDEENYLT